jgi:hypothetical protein
VTPEYPHAFGSPCCGQSSRNLSRPIEYGSPCRGTSHDGRARGRAARKLPRSVCGLPGREHQGKSPLALAWPCGSGG